MEGDKDSGSLTKYCNIVEYDRVNLNIETNNSVGISDQLSKLKEDYALETDRDRFGQSPFIPAK